MFPPHFSLPHKSLSRQTALNHYYYIHILKLHTWSTIKLPLKLVSRLIIKRQSLLEETFHNIMLVLTFHVDCHKISTVRNSLTSRLRSCIKGTSLHELIYDRLTCLFITVPRFISFLKWTPSFLLCVAFPEAPLESKLTQSEWKWLSRAIQLDCRQYISRNSRNPRSGRTVERTCCGKYGRDVNWSVLRSSKKRSSILKTFARCTRRIANTDLQDELNWRGK